MRKKILLVGCGNIGFRYLQALLLTNLTANIYLEDKDFKKKKNILKKINFIKNNKINFFLKNFHQKRFDLIIVATTSRDRFKIINKFISNYKFKNIILEKVVFQKLDHFSKVNNFFKKKNIKCFVNCSRREQIFYNKFKKILSLKENLKMNVSGNKWNMASNIIHFLDLYLMYKGLDCFKLYKHNVKVTNSKHVGYFEITGYIKLKNSLGDEITFSDLSKNKDIKVSFYNKGEKYLINETKQTFRVNKRKYIKIILMPHSLLYKNIFIKIFKSRKIRLCSLDDAYKSHFLFFKILDDILKKKGTGVFEKKNFSVT